MNKLESDYTLEWYYVNQIIEEVLKSRNIQASAEVRSHSNIMFFTAQEDFVKDVIENILLIKQYKCELAKPVESSVLKRIIGVDENISVPVIEEKISTYDRIEVKFETKELKSLLKEETGIDIEEVKVEDYYDFCDGDVSCIHLITKEYKPILQNTLCKSGARLYFNYQGPVVVLDRADFANALEEPLQPFGEYSLFIENGRIEFREDRLILCMDNIVSEEIRMRALEKLRAKPIEDPNYYIQYVSSTEKYGKDYFWNGENIEQFYQCCAVVSGIPKEYRKKYEMIMTIRISDIVHYLTGFFKMNVDNYRVIDGECYLLSK